MSVNVPRLGYLARGVIMVLDGAVDDLEAGECTPQERERIASSLERLVAALRAESAVITIRAERTDR